MSVDIATAEMIAAVGNNLNRLITDLFVRVEQLDQRISTTLENSPMILENLNNRINKLEDRLGALPSDETLEAAKNIDERIEKVADARIQEWMDNNFDDSFDDRKDYHSLQDESDVDSAIERALEDFSVGDAVDEYLKYNRDVIRDVVKEMTFTVEVE